MELALYNYVFIVMNAVRTYCIFKLMHIFFNTVRVTKVREILSYVFLYLILTIVRLFNDIPIVMLISNIIGLVLISINYQQKIKKRLVSIMFITFVLFIAETVVTVLTGYINFPLFDKNNYSSIFGIVSLQIVLYTITTGLQKFKNIRNGAPVPVMHWIGLATIPAFSLYIIVILFYAKGLSIVQILICLLFLLWININVFTLYDSVLAYSAAQAEKRLLIQQNNYYEKQFELMQSSEKAMRSMRHDWINHISAMKELLLVNNKEVLQQYLDEAEKKIKQHSKQVDSGSLILDSILNFKLREATQNNIKTNVDVKVPDKLNIASFDLTVILGNLLDNAIQASMMIESQDRLVKINIMYKIGILTITIENNFNGDIICNGKNIVTSKKEKENHGYGIMNVKKVVEKYNGIFKTEHSDKIFAATVMLLVECID